MIRHENVLKISLQDVLKTSWRCLEEVFARRLHDVLKTSWRCYEEVLPKRIYWFWSRHLDDVLKTSSEDVWLRRIDSFWSRRLENVFWRHLLKMSSELNDERRLQDAFIKANVCCNISMRSKKTQTIISAPVYRWLFFDLVDQHRPC